VAHFLNSSIKEDTEHIDIKRELSAVRGSGLWKKKNKGLGRKIRIPSTESKLKEQCE